MILLHILQTSLIKDALFQHTSLKSIFIFRFHHPYELLHTKKNNGAEIRSLLVLIFLFRTLTRFLLLFWRLCKRSSCINPILGPYFFTRSIKKTQSLRYFYQINCDKILNNSNKLHLCTSIRFKSRKLSI